MRVANFNLTTIRESGTLVKIGLPIMGTTNGEFNLYEDASYRNC